MSKIAFVVLAAGAASAFVVPTSRTPARTAPVMAAKPGGLAEFQQKAIATAVSLMLVAGPISFAPDAALAADGGAFSDSTTLTLAGLCATTNPSPVFNTHFFQSIARHSGNLFGCT